MEMEEKEKEKAMTFMEHTREQTKQLDCRN